MHQIGRELVLTNIAEKPRKVGKQSIGFGNLTTVADLTSRRGIEAHRTVLNSGIKTRR